MQRLKYDDREIRKLGLKTLTKNLGYAGAIRFLRQFTKGEGDYLKLQERLFEGQTVEDLYQAAERHTTKKKTRP